MELVLIYLSIGFVLTLFCNHVFQMTWGEAVFNFFMWPLTTVMLIMLLFNREG